MCCVQYDICATYNGIALADWANADATNMGSSGVFNEGWSFDINTGGFLIDATQTNVGLVDSQCTGDYVEIPSERTIRQTHRHLFYYFNDITLLMISGIAY